MKWKRQVQEEEGGIKRTALKLSELDEFTMKIEKIVYVQKYLKVKAVT